MEPPEWVPQLAPPIEEPAPPDPGPQVPWGTIAVCALLGAVFVVQRLGSPHTCTGEALWGMCAARQLMAVEPVVAVSTFPLLHGNLEHLVRNLVPFLLIGVAIEQDRSAMTLLGVFLLGAYLSVYADAALAVAHGSPSVAIGASGGSRAIGAYFVTQFVLTRPSVRRRVATAMSRPLEPIAIACNLVAPVLAGSLLLFSALEYAGILDVAANIAIFAHLVGAAFGTAVGVTLR